MRLSSSAAWPARAPARAGLADPAAKAALTLEQQAGLATGWKPCDSVDVARIPERMQVLRKQAVLARSFGVEVQLISPREAGMLGPVTRPDDLQGAIWIPGDGKANRADLCMSLVNGLASASQRSPSPAMT